MPRRSPLACPRCASERSCEGEFAARICDDCGIEFRPRGRIPYRRDASKPVERFGGWTTTFAIAGIAALIGVLTAIKNPSPPSFDPPAVVIPPPSFDIGSVEEFAFQPLAPPEVNVVTHRLERGRGRVELTGLLAISDRIIARPQVHVAFLGSSGEEIGGVLANVACTRIDALPCPWGFVGLEPLGTADVRVWASGESDMGDFTPVARLRFGFDDELDATTRESNLPELDEASAELIAQGDELEVKVGLPNSQRLRSGEATLVGYAEGSFVELVLPLPSPVGLARRVALPEHARTIVRWQLWVEGPLGSY